MENTNKGPVKKIKAGGISIAIWENQSQFNGQEAIFKTVSLQRTYKDKQDQWQHTSSLRVSDIPKAILVLQKAYEELILMPVGELQPQPGQQQIQPNAPPVVPVGPQQQVVQQETI